MERIKKLDIVQKVILLLLAVMFAVFTPIYCVVTSRVGYEYDEAMLYPTMDGDTTIYAGEWNDKEVCFTVTADNVVTFRYGQKAYGPYTIREDPTAIPEGIIGVSHVKGIEILQGERVYFRGGILGSGDNRILLSQDGRYVRNGSLSEQGILHYDEDGKVIDRLAPSATAIWELTEGPELTSRGNWMGLFGGVVISVLTAYSILYADEIFRRNLSWRIRNPENAEPSDWELASRYISWTGLPLIALVMYIMGLQI